MHELNALIIALQDFFAAGGDVLWIILLLTILLWGLILERFWFFGRRYPRELEATLARWRKL